MISRSVDNAANRHALLGIDDTREGDTMRLPFGRFAQQILVLTEEHASERVRPVEQRCIVDLVVVVLVRREDIHPACA